MPICLVIIRFYATNGFMTDAVVWVETYAKEARHLSEEAVMSDHE